MLEIAVPKYLQEGGTYVIPGHGRVSDEADLLDVPRHGRDHSRSHSGHVKRE